MRALQGFGMCFLLKLKDNKAVDTKTTLLQFCTEQAMDQSQTLAALPSELKHLKPASRLEIFAVTSTMADLHAGGTQAKAAVLATTQLESQQTKEGADKVRIAYFPVVLLLIDSNFNNRGLCRG